MKKNNTNYFNVQYIKYPAILFIAYLICFLISIYSFHNQSTGEVYNQARIILQEDMEYLRTKISSSDEIDESLVEHQFYLVGLDGIIIKSNMSDKTAGEKINMIKELQMDHAYTSNKKGFIKVVFPILKDEQVDEFAVFSIREKNVTEDKLILFLKNILPINIFVIVVIVIITCYLSKQRRSVMQPIEEMTDSSIAIIKGDYSRQIIQTRNKDKPQNQVQNLVYRFEQMRDELKNRYECEQKLKKEQKELMSCMSHDLRTPITTIQVHAMAIRDGIVKDETKKAEYIETIIRKTEFLNHMIADLLDHSNAQLNQLKIEKHEIYFRQFIDELSQEIYTYCEKQGYAFNYKNDCGDLLVVIDRNRITQVIYNLVENACKYMDKGENGKVSLTCHLVKEERRIYISIKDNGQGIEMADIPYVFDRFYRAEKSRSMQIPGAGLGLAICQYIVKKHNGEISLKSRKEQGCEVTFYLNV